MGKGYSKFLNLVQFIGDVTLLNMAFLIACILKPHLYNGGEFSDHYIFLYIIFNLVWILVVFIFNLYKDYRGIKLEHILWTLGKSLSLHLLIIFSFIAAIKGSYFSREHLLWTYLIFGVGLFTWRLTLIFFLRKYRKKGYNYRNVVIVGAGAAGNKIYNFLKSDLSNGYKFLGFFDDTPNNCLHKNLILGSVKDLKNFANKAVIDEIFYTLPLISEKKIKNLSRFADNNLIRLRLVPDFRNFLHKKIDLDFYDSVPVLTLRKEPLEIVFNGVIKRLFDIVFSLLMILLVFPWLFPVLALLIKISSKGPVFFVQRRSGRSNKIFSCYKFRSMNVNDDADKIQAITRDPRITMIGKFLRKTNMDELPQFFNVLLGNMSVVGPRPHMIKHTDEYSKTIDKFMVRHLVKPGITGWAQAHGLRGKTDQPCKMLHRVRHDLWYIENWSFILDIKIIFLTVYTMLIGNKNAA